jgi:hypothetical protein
VPCEARRSVKIDTDAAGGNGCVKPAQPKKVAGWRTTIAIADIATMTHIGGHGRSRRSWPTIHLQSSRD